MRTLLFVTLLGAAVPAHAQYYYSPPPQPLPAHRAYGELPGWVPKPLPPGSPGTTILPQGYWPQPLPGTR